MQETEKVKENDATEERRNDLRASGDEIILSLKETLKENLDNACQLAIVQTKSRYAAFKLDEVEDSVIGEMVLGRSFVSLKIAKFDKKAEEAAIKGNKEKVREEMEENMVTVKIEDIFKEAKRILVQGEAGVGKSTFLRRIAQRWACEGLWKEMFDFVIHITLRNVKDCQTLEKIVSISLFEGDDSLTKTFMNWIYERKDRILWIFDGWDEINVVEGSVLWEIQQGQHKDIIYFLGGSRSEATKHIKSDLLLQIQGFTSNGIQRYIKLYFGECTSYESCLTLLCCLKRVYPVLYQYLRRNIGEVVLNFKPKPKPEAGTVRGILVSCDFLRDACRVPLMLRLVCMIQSKETETRTSTYEKLIKFVLDRSIEKSKIVQIERDVKKLAWEGFKKQNLIVSEDMLYSHCENTLDVIERCGLLKDEGLIGLDHSFVWIHYSFQEFLAAKYVCTDLSKMKIVDELKRIRNRIGEKSNVFFIFICGIGGNANDCMNEWFPDVEVEYSLKEVKELSWMSEGNKFVEKVFDERLNDEDLVKCLQNSSSWGHVDAVKYLIGCGVDPSVNDNASVRYASENGYLEVVKLLLEDKRVDPSSDNSYAIRWASENGHLEVVKLLLQDKRVHPSANNNHAIGEASRNGHVEVVKLLLQDERVDPPADTNYAIRYASRNGHLEVVKLLLEEEGVDPSAGNNYALRYASISGHVEVVKLLLQDKKVDPSADDNYAIGTASENGHVEVVKLLLQDTRVEPFARNNDAIQCASRNGHVEIVKLLLQASANPSARNNYAIQWASRNGHVEIVKLLLQDKRVDPCADDNYAIRYAARKGYVEVVKLLLQDKRVDPSAEDNYAVQWASDNGHVEVVKLLQLDERVDSSANEKHAIRLASKMDIWKL